MIGAGGALSVTSSTASSTTATQSSRSPLPERGRDDGWTDRQSFQDDTTSHCMSNVKHTTHTLSYLDVSWDAFGAPHVDGDAGGQGCWRHTFALAGLGAAETPSGEFGPGLPYGTVSVNVPTVGSDESHPAERADETLEPTATAVGARRSPATFNFVERGKFEGHLLGRDVGPSDLSSVDVDDDTLHDRVYEARNAVAGDPEVRDSIALSAASTALGSVPGSTDDLAKLQRYANGGSVLVDAINVADEYLDVLAVEDNPRVDRGFSATFPEEIYEESDIIVSSRRSGAASDKNWMRIGCGDSGVYLSAGCHYLLFDVFEAPGSDHASAVDVVSAFDRTPSGTVPGPSAGWSIVLDTPEPGGAPSSVTGSERFSATVEASDHVSRRDPSEEVTN